LALSFFPIILAGPIQRPVSLLPQITKKRVFNYDQAVDGLKQILWGLFAKVVIADNLAVFADNIFLNYSNYSGSTLLLGALFYTIQIYADFSGYSDMAIGVAKLFGFSLMRNFAYPYFSRDITEFWKRWHISLVTWFRDYVFLPLSFTISWRISGEKVLFIKTDLFIYIVASIVVWFLTGLWHGANYTFIIWGLIHGFLLIVYHLQRNPRKKLFKRIGINNKNSVIVGIETIITLIIIVVAWIFFRAENIGQALNYLSEIFSPSLFAAPTINKMAVFPVFFILIFFTMEWIGRKHEYSIQKTFINQPRYVRWSFYYGFFISLIIFMGHQESFIYFQF